MNSVLAMNDKGIAMLSMGDYEGASAAFGTAVKQARAGCSPNATLSPFHAGSFSAELKSVKVDNLIEFRRDFAIFGECFTLSPLPVNHTPQDPNFLVTTMLYNGALARQLQSLRTSNSSETLLKATHLYKLALQLLRKCIVKDAYFYLVLLAICNNVAVIALETYDLALFQAHRGIMAAVLLETEVPEVFASNFVGSMGIMEQPAAAA